MLSLALCLPPGQHCVREFGAESFSTHRWWKAGCKGEASSCGRLSPTPEPKLLETLHSLLYNLMVQETSDKTTFRKRDLFGITV